SDSTRAVAAAVGRQVAQRDGRERVRLLYVGFTRARDHLVLAVPLDAKGNSRTAWLDELVDEQGTILELPNSPLHPLQVRGTTGEYQAAARVWTLTANSNGAANDSPDDSCVSGKAAGTVQEDPGASSEANGSVTTREHSRWWLVRNRQQRCEVRHWLHPSLGNENAISLLPPGSPPSSASHDASRLLVPLPQPGTRSARPFTDCSPSISGKPPKAIAIDVARTILTRAGLAAAFDAVHLISASDALRAFVNQHWPD